MDLPKPKPSKRLDLQGIRALAIIVVLGFHFFPEYCPNGYLGVDQFFVLSGFLMCMLLKRAENQSPCSLVTIFYSKRFKRILPLYLLIILISMISLYFFFPDTAIETNKESALHALLFVSNRPKTDQEDYFQMLSLAVDIFTHTWSLSVEIQFYFLVPFIFLFATKIPEKFQYSYYGLIGVFSFIFFYISSATVAFNSVFARIWQFLIGMVVYLLSTPITPQEVRYQPLNNGEGEEDVECQKKLLEETEEEEEVVDEKEEGIEKVTERSGHWKYSNAGSYALLVFVVYIVTFPLPLSAGLVRPIVTICTGLLMLVSENNRILSYKILTYIGDISYSLYLIHWPIYSYWKLTGDGNKNLLILALISSIVLAVITYELFENWYLKLSSTSVGVLVVMLFFMNVVVINKDDISNHIDSIGRNFSRLDGVTENMTFDDATRLNYHWSVNDQKNLFSATCVYEEKNTPLGWCRHTGLKPTGKYKLAIIGNSWTANHATMFYQECGYRAKSILQGAAYGCEPLYPSTDIDRCRNEMKSFDEHLKSEKPDYAFIFTRYISIGQPFPKNVTSFDKDPTYQIMKNQTFKYLSNIKYKLYILDAIPRTIAAAINNFGAFMKNGTDPVVLDKMFVDFTEYEMARKRHAQLAKDCGERCVLVDYVPEFYNNATKTFRYFDEKGFSYHTAISHMSPHGLEHVRHVWTDISDSCTRRTNATILLAYSTDSLQSDVDYARRAIIGNIRNFNPYQKFANIRFDVKQEESIQYHSDLDSFNASVIAHPADSTIGYGDKSTGSDVFNVIEKFLNNDQATICGSIIYVLVKRYPNENDVATLITRLRSNHVFLYFIVHNVKSGGSDTKSLFDMSSQTNGFCIFMDTTNYWAVVNSGLAVLYRPYQFIAQNYVVFGEGRIEIPNFRIPCTTFYCQQTMSVITIQDHKLDTNYISLNYTISTLDGTHVFTGPDIGSGWPRFGSGIIAHPKLNGTVDYKLTIDYKFRTSQSQFIEVRMYSNSYHDFVPFNQPVDSCTPRTNTTILFAYSTDSLQDDVYYVRRAIIGEIRSFYPYQKFANIRFDVKQEENIQYHSDLDSFNASVIAHPPDSTIGYGDKTTGSDVFRVVENFLNNDRATICGSIIYVLVKRYPNENDVADLITRLRENHVFVYFIVHNVKSGGLDTKSLFDMSSQTNGFCIFMDTRYYWVDGVEGLAVLYRPYQFIAQNYVVFGEGRIEIPNFRIPCTTFYCQQTMSVITIQDHKLDTNFISLNYTISTLDGTHVFTGPDIGSGWVRDEGVIIAHPSLNGNVDYKLTIDYKFRKSLSQFIEVRMYSSSYHDFVPFNQQDNSGSKLPIGI